MPSQRSCGSPHCSLSRPLSHFPASFSAARPSRQPEIEAPAALAAAVTRRHAVFAKKGGTFCLAQEKSMHRRRDSPSPRIALDLASRRQQREERSAATTVVRVRVRRWEGYKYGQYSTTLTFADHQTRLQNDRTFQDCLIGCFSSCPERAKQSQARREADADQG